MDKKRLIPQVQIGSRGLGIADMRIAAKSDSAAFMQRTQKLVDDGKLKLSELGDLRTLYAALADVPVTIHLPDAIGAMRAVSSSAFPVLVSSTVVAAINDAYAAVPTIGEQLVSELDDPKAITTVARIANLDNAVEQVTEGNEYPEIGASEDVVEIAERPNGRRISITAQAIRRNDLANIVERVNAVGTFAATFVEKLTLKRVTDCNGSAATPAAPYAYRPGGTGTSLFSATANTPGTRAPSGTRYETNALADETDLDNVRGRLASMRDDNGNPIPVDYNSVVVLVPDALIHTLMKIKNSEMVPGTENAMSNWGPRGMWGGFRPLSSPYLDLWSTNAWYYGVPTRQFKRKWALRYEYVTLGESTESYLRSSVAFQARVAWNCEVGAVDYVHWVQCLSGSTPPVPA